MCFHVITSKKQQLSNFHVMKHQKLGLFIKLVTVKLKGNPVIRLMKISIAKNLVSV